MCPKVSVGILSPLLLVVASCASALGQEKMEPRKLRTWTDSTGKYKVEAAFVQFKDGKVRLKKADGRTLDVSIDRLSEQDQEYVKTQLRRQAGAAGSRKRPITLEELRKRKPICGVPCDGRKRFIQRMLAWKREQIEDWAQRSKRLGGPANKVQAVAILASKASLLFDDKDAYKEDVYRRFIKRLDGLSQEHVLEWVRPLNKDFNLEVLLRDTWFRHIEAVEPIGRGASNWSVAITLAAIDELYDNADKCDYKKARKYLTRLSGLSKKDLAVWLEKVDQSLPDDAIFAILLTEDFFRDDHFDDNAFKSTLEWNRSD